MARCRGEKTYEELVKYIHEEVFIGKSPGFRPKATYGIGTDMRPRFHFDSRYDGGSDESYKSSMSTS